MCSPIWVSAILFLCYVHLIKIAGIYTIHPQKSVDSLYKPSSLILADNLALHDRLKIKDRCGFLGMVLVYEVSILVFKTECEH